MLSQIEVALVFTFLISSFVSITIYGICYCRRDIDKQSSDVDNYKSMD